MVLVKKIITSIFYLKSGVNRWCKIVGGVIRNTIGENYEEYFFVS